MNEPYNLTFIHREESLVLLVIDDTVCFDVDVFTWIQETEFNAVFTILEVVVPVEAIGCALVEVGTECHDAVFLSVDCDFELCLVGFVGAVDIAIDGNSDAFKVDEVLFRLWVAKSFNAFAEQLGCHSNEALFQADGFRFLHFDADFFVGNFAAVLFNVFQGKVEACR